MLAIVVAVLVVVWAIGLVLLPVGWVVVWVVCVWLAIKLERARTPEQRAAWRPSGVSERALSESELLRR
jgi:hypothetical protein